MKFIYFITWMLSCTVLTAQSGSKYNVSFKKDKDTVRRSSGEDKLMQIPLSASNTKNEDLKEHKLYVTIDIDHSTLPKADYEIISDIKGNDLNDLSESPVYRILIKKDNTDDKQLKNLKLVLKLSIKKKTDNEEIDDDTKNNEGKTKEIVLIIEPAEFPLESYRYLGYLGTNFDLVDGLEANKLFFAVNILIPEVKRLGVSLGLYGNRTMSKTDTSINVSFTSRIEAYGRDSLVYYRDTGMYVRKQISDNIGAFFTPIFPLKFIKEGNLKVYYAPNFEFIWRRRKFETTFANNATIAKDTGSNRLPANVALPLITPLRNKYEQNVYDMYLGAAGLMIRLETDDISMRLQGAFGVNFNYTPVGGSTTQNIYFQKNTNLYFQGRLWITEPTTGLSIGAELSNILGNKKSTPEKKSKAQPYYNVTLSKAFNLKNLASIVKPLTSR